jgi:hypothetical protein
MTLALQKKLDRYLETCKQIENSYSALRKEIGKSRQNIEIPTGPTAALATLVAGISTGFGTIRIPGTRFREAGRMNGCD